MAQTISKVTMSVGILAVLAGLFAAVGVRSFLEQGEVAPPTVAKEPAKPRTIKVPLAAVDLPADRLVNATDLTQLSMTVQRLEEQYKVDPEQVVITPRTIINRYLVRPIKRGQPFLTTDFYLEGTSPSITKKLQPGFRAIRVQVPVSREANVQTGMFVDVFFRSNARPAKGDQPAMPEKTVTLLRHVEVIDAERPVAPHSTKGTPNVVNVSKKPLLFTLAVPEPKADMFGVVEGRGELWLVPAPAGDKGSADGLGGVNADTLAELLGIKPPSKPQPPFETAIYTRGQLKINRFVDGKLLANHAAYRNGTWDGGKDAAPKDSNESNTPAPPAPGKDD